jgi:hypothetical protein
MISRSTIRLNTDGLDLLRKQLAAAKGSAMKVGLLGDHAERGVVPLSDTQMGPLKPDKLNNPTLGLIHEKGSVSAKPPVPRRSWLKEPLESELPKRIREIGVEAWRKLILERGLIEALKFLGVEAVNVIDGGFATGGYGKWKELSPVTVALKGSDAILIETSQMRKAVSSALVKGRAT